MLKNQSMLEVVKQERTYQLLLEGNSPLGEVYDVLTQMMAYVIQRINESAPPKKEEAEEECKPQE